MRRAKYMSREEMLQWLKIGVLAGECAAIADQTDDKAWHKKLRTMATYAQQITDERLQCLEPEQVSSVARRNKTAKMIMLTEDRERYDKIEKEKVYNDLEDLETIAELALNSCQICPEGSCVKDCRFRLAMHRLGIAVASDNPAPGKCEFKVEVTQNVCSLA